MVQAGKMKIKESKKKKKAWRKTDTGDVDAYLEDKRLEERLGKPFEERTDSELFQIDTRPTVKEGPLSNAEKKRRAFLPPRCYEILEPSSAVPDPIKKRNRVRTKEERRDRIAKSKDEMRKKLKIRKRKEIDSIKQKRAHKWRLKKEARKDPFKVNPWTDENDKFNGLGKWFETDTVHHNLTKTGRIIDVIKTPGSVQIKPSIIRPIPKPHPGTSYNPTLEDHTRLLRSVAEKEASKTKKELQLAREMSQFRILEPKQIEAEWMENMMEGLNDDEESDSSDDDKSCEIRSVNKPVTRDRKKKASQRLRKKEHERKLRELKKKKLEKRRQADLDRVKSYSKLIDLHIQNEVTRQEKLTKRKAIRDKVLTKRLGKNKFEAPPLEFSQREDITGSLRTITPVGNIAANVFTNLQRRNIIEVTRKQFKSKKVKKKRTKTYKKRSHVLPTS